jgi:hypothetical protein
MENNPALVENPVSEEGLKHKPRKGRNQFRPSPYGPVLKARRRTSQQPIKYYGNEPGYSEAFDTGS